MTASSARTSSLLRPFIFVLLLFSIVMFLSPYTPPSSALPSADPGTTPGTVDVSRTIDTRHSLLSPGSRGRRCWTTQKRIWRTSRGGPTRNESSSSNSGSHVFQQQQRHPPPQLSLALGSTTPAMGDPASSLPWLRVI